MIFESITLENFRQYKDKEIINFSNDKDKNITVILGDNTSGKTTLLNAFKWALYQKNNFLSSKNKIANQSLLNKEAEAELRKDGDTAIVKVTIKLKHNNSLYVVSTSQEFVRVSGQIKERQISTRVSINKSASEKSQSVLEDNLARKEISSILPEKLSDYFFFDTENINTITKKENLSESIKEILQLNISEYLIDILNADKAQTVVRYLNNKKVYNNSQSTLALKEEQSKLLKLQETLSFELAEKNKELKNFEDQLKDYEEDLAKYKQIETKIVERDKAKKSSEDLRLELIKEVRKLIGDFGDYNGAGSERLVNYVLGYQIKKTKLLDSIIKIENQEKGYLYIQGEAVDHIISEGICICGTPIVKGSHNHKNLLEEKKKLPPLSYSANLSALSRKLSSSLAVYKYFETEVSEKIVSISRLQQKYAEENENLLKLNKEIEKSKIKEITNIQSSINSTQSFINNSRDLIPKLEAKLELNKIQLSDIDKKLISAELEEVRNNRVDNALAIVKKLYIKVKNSYDEKLSYSIKTLEEETTNVYNSIYHGKKGKIKIDERFNASITDSFGKIENDPGAGRNAVMNFSFVTGIVKMAKEKIDKEDQQIYPLVMDAPLSLLDEKHINNLLYVLPSTIDQVIIFVMEKDWAKSGSQVNNRIGKKYSIRKQRDAEGNFLDTYSKIVEVK